MNILIPTDAAIVQVSTEGVHMDSTGGVSMTGPLLRLVSDIQTALEVHAEECSQIREHDEGDGF